VNFGFVTSLVVIIFAVVGVFIEIPVVSNYAFWFAIGAYILLAGSRF
jgi:NhaP-type Na+/H+ or K+/H+ antiporter